LPTHRALAKALGIDLTTVTRAYAEARQRELTRRTGRGTFVAESLSQPRHPAAASTFDLSMNLPPQPLEADLEGRITRGLAAIQRAVGFSAHLNYREPGGSDAERDIAAAWLRPRLADARGDRLVICPGTQNALFNLLIALTSPGDIILTEALTYPGIKAVAACAGVRLVGVGSTRTAFCPMLDAACAQHCLKAVYLIPTIHNPTTATMPMARREQVADFAPMTLLLEDDAYGMPSPVRCRSRRSSPSARISPRACPSALRRGCACRSLAPDRDAAAPVSCARAPACRCRRS
jgi:DNA-binding transcriptional MocR family regulator